MCQCAAGVFNRGSGTPRGSSELLQGAHQMFVCDMIIILFFYINHLNPSIPFLRRTLAKNSELVDLLFLAKEV